MAPGVRYGLDTAGMDSGHFPGRPKIRNTRVNYYNEWDKGAAAWLRELIKAGLIPNGYVDDRSITEVTPSDLEGFTQCHFFAGIGGWSYALQIAGIPAKTRLWTGSPPCQPFSVAGKQLGQFDERHLAPVFMRLVGECRPPVLFGEQVAAAIGKNWLDDLFLEMERQGYACGAAVLPACSIGAPHERKRLFFGAHLLANANTQQRHGERLHGSTKSNSTDSCRASAEPAGHCDTGSVANYDGQRSQRQRPDRHPQGWQKQTVRQAGLCDGAGIVGSVEHPGSQRREWGQTAPSGHQHDRETPQRSQGQHGAGESGTYRFFSIGTGPHRSVWSGADWLSCKDGKFRPVEPGTFPLANGIPARVGRLRGYGNAIVPQVAAEFIKAFEGAVEDAGN